MSDESDHKPDLLTVMARALLQVTHIVGAKDAHEEIKRALHEHDADAMPEAYRDAPEPVVESQHGDEQPE
jgi:hypothetical protein